MIDKHLTETEAKILLNKFNIANYGLFAKIENTKLNTDYQCFVEIPNIEEITDIDPTTINYDNDFRQYDTTDKTVLCGHTWHDVEIGVIINEKHGDWSSWEVIPVSNAKHIDLELAQAIYNKNLESENLEWIDELFADQSFSLYL